MEPTNEPTSETTANSPNENPLPLAGCLFRKIDQEGNLLCSLAAKFSELPVQQCVVSERACRHCMSLPVVPETPNEVVASMAVGACREGDPEHMAVVLQRMTPFLKKSEHAAGRTGQGQPSRVTAEDLPCVHRGEKLRTVECEICGSRGQSMDVHRCEKLHRECTAGRWSNEPNKEPNLQCLGCQARKEPERLIQLSNKIDQRGGATASQNSSPLSDDSLSIRSYDPTPTEPRPELSIVMATHTDYDGVWFTIEILRAFHADVLADTNAEIVVVDTAPDSPHGKAVRDFIKSWCNGDTSPGGGTDRVRGRYIAAGDSIGITGTAAPRDWAIRQARGEIVLGIDCHVIMMPGSLFHLVDFFRCNPTSIDMIHGPLIHDNFRVAATKMRPAWGEDQMFGKWDSKGDVTPDGKSLSPGRFDDVAFEIPMHGMGMFACRKIAWPGYNPAFAGFGGEEGYIHEKIRRAGGKVYCLPQLGWIHRFGRPGGVPYRLMLEDKFRNYLIASRELDQREGAGAYGGLLSRDEILRQFAGKIDAAAYGRIVAEVSGMT